MATTDKRTRADLLAELAAAQQEAQDARSVAYEARQAIPAAPTAVPEAVALADCIRALDRLRTARESGSTGGYALGYGGSGGYRESSSTERVLVSLASKYGIELIRTEIREQPCSRRHVDELDAGTVMAALHGSPRPF